MNLPFIANKTLQVIDYTTNELPKAEYDNCTFIDCNLNRAIFDNTNLEKVDFTSAHDFLINLEINRLKLAKFSKNNVIGLLKKYNIKTE